MISVENSESGDEGSREEETPESLERALKLTIAEFSDYVGAIVKDLEDKEQETIQKLVKRKKTPPTAIWQDASFKVDFTKGMLMKLFTDERRIKYYVVLLLPMKPWLKKRKEKFFTDVNLFPGAPEKDVQFFKNLWIIDGTLTPDEKNTIWEFWDTLTDIADDWQQLTGWKPRPEDKMQIPDVNYEKAAVEAGVTLSDEDE